MARYSQCYAYAAPVSWATPRDITRIPTTTPPMEEVSDHRNTTVANAPQESGWPEYPPEVRPGR